MRVVADGAVEVPEHVLDRLGAAGGSSASRPRGPGTRSSMRVVVADDSLLTRAGIVSVLGDVGCEVVAEARDGVEALAAVRLHRPDAAVLDIRMPPTYTDEGLVAAHESRPAFPEPRFSFCRSTSSLPMRCA